MAKNTFALDPGGIFLLTNLLLDTIVANAGRIVSVSSGARLIRHELR